MLNKKSFTHKSLKDAEEYFKNVHMTQEQHEIFKDFVRIFIDHIPLSELSVKGIGWRAIKEWQINKRRDLWGIASESHDERIYAISQILKEYVKNDLLESLIDKNDEPLLDKAIDDILAFYDKTYAGR